MMDRLQFLLLKLSEEASELAQIASKTIQFGLHEKHPDPDQTNLERIDAELNDLLTIIYLLNTEFDTGLGEDLNLREAKIKKIDKYYKYSVRLGMVKEA